MIIDFSNIETLVFMNIEVQKQLPEFKNSFQQWKLGQIVPSLRPTAKKALLDVLNNLDNKVLEKYFGETVTINKLDYALVKNYILPLANTQEINKLGIEGELFLHRDANNLYIGTWK